jgi:ubiquinone/menaquinone biosynthesis C-methylase UbiE
LNNVLDCSSIDMQTETTPFDNYAREYDAHFTDSPIGQMQRKRVQQLSQRYFKKQIDVLEINCGTGTDALFIAGKVRYVLATDISKEMVKVANKKKAQSGLVNLEFLTADINKVHQSAAKQYDLLFSNFGGLNCLNPVEIKQFSQQIAPFIKEDGHLIFVLMGRNCVFENMYFRLRKDPALHRRRALNGVGTKIGDQTFLTHYYSDVELSVLFAEHYSVLETKPVGLFIPPSYLNPFFKNKKVWLYILNFLERLFGRFSFLAAYSDHYLMVLKKEKS